MQPDLGGLTFDQTGPHGFVLRPRSRRFAAASSAFGGKQTSQRARAGVAHAHQVHAAEHCGERVCAQAAMSKAELFVARLDQQGGADIAVTALLEVSLQQETRNLAALVGLLRFDGMERELQACRRGEPGLQEGELDSGRRRRARRGSCSATHWRYSCRSYKPDQVEVILKGREPAP